MAVADLQPGQVGRAPLPGAGKVAQAHLASPGPFHVDGDHRVRPVDSGQLRVRLFGIELGQLGRVEGVQAAVVSQQYRAPVQGGLSPALLLPAPEMEGEVEVEVDAVPPPQVRRIPA